MHTIPQNTEKDTVTVTVKSKFHYLKDYSLQQPRVQDCFSLDRYVQIDTDTNQTKSFPSRLEG